MDFTIEYLPILNVLNYEYAPEFFRNDRIFLNDIVYITMEQFKREDGCRWEQSQIIIDTKDGNVKRYFYNDLEKCKKDFEIVFKLWDEFKKRI